MDKQLQRLLANEKSNFKALAEAVGKIGGIPPLMMSSDMVNTLPDEKVKPQMKLLLHVQYWHYRV